MFLVGGGILVHGLPPLHAFIHGVEHQAGAIPAVGAVLAGLTPMLANALTGVVVGGLIVLVVTLFRRAFAGASRHPAG